MLLASMLDETVGSAKGKVSAAFQSLERSPCQLGGGLEQPPLACFG